jgi:ankyrin repeat protein
MQTPEAPESPHLTEPGTSTASVLLRARWLGPLLRYVAPGVGRRLFASALNQATLQGDEAALVRLLNAPGADPDAPEAIVGRRPLMSAARKGWAPGARHLLDAGAHVNATDQEGGTALLYAAEAGQTELVALLLDAGGEIDAADARGQTALFTAAGAGDLPLVRLLVARGADIGIRWRGQVTAADWARGMAAATQMMVATRELCPELGDGQDQLGCAAYLDSLAQDSLDGEAGADEARRERE